MSHMKNEHKSHIQSPEVLKKIGVSLARRLMAGTMVLGTSANANEDTSESSAFPGMLDAVDPSEISIVSDQHAENADEDASSEGSVEINRIGEEEDTPDSESEDMVDVESDVESDNAADAETDSEAVSESEGTLGLGAEADVESENTADVESDVELDDMADVESDVEADVESDVEADVESDVEADPNAVVNDEATVIDGDELEGLPHTNGDAPQISLIASAMAFAMGAGLVLYSRRRQGQ